MDELKVLGQDYPAAATLVDLYIVPTSTNTTVSSITACNQGAGPALFRVSIAVSGAADSTKQYIYWDETVPSNTTFIATVGLTLAAGDVIRVYSDTGTVSFNVFGVQVT